MGFGCDRAAGIAVREVDLRCVPIDESFVAAKVL